jgi:hypothetical protein
MRINLKRNWWDQFGVFHEMRNNPHELPDDYPVHTDVVGEDGKVVKTKLNLPAGAEVIDDKGAVVKEPKGRTQRVDLQGNLIVKAPEPAPAAPKVDKGLALKQAKDRLEAAKKKLAATDAKDEKERANAQAEFDEATVQLATAEGL